MVETGRFVEHDGVAVWVEVDGDGEPVTVFAHGLTNSGRELASLTPVVPGTKVRFDFRGHGRSGAPPTGYRFVDFAADLAAVADAFGATRAVGTSLGAGAICNLLTRNPDRFERIILLLPAGLDLEFRHKERFLRMADLLETRPKDEAIEAILADPERLAAYAKAPWLRDFDRALWADLNPEGVSRAIREVVHDHPVEDREALRRVTAPTLIIARHGDPIHPAEVAVALAELLPNAELELFADEVEMFVATPRLVQRAVEFLSA